MRLHCVFFCLIFCCAACQSDRKQSPVPIVYLHSDSCVNNLDISEILEDTVEVIKLETTDGSLIGNIDDIRFTDKHIFVSDLRVAQKIYMFDKYGKFIRTISKKGAGPKEYSVIGAFVVKGDSLFIQDYYQNKYLVYDISENQLKDDIPYTTHHNGVLALNNQLYFVSSYFISPLGDYNLFKFDLNTGRINAYLPFARVEEDKRSSWTLRHPCDYINESTAFAYYFFNDTIYQIGKTEIRPQYVITFSKKTEETLDSRSINNITGVIHLQQSDKYMMGIYTFGRGLKYFFLDKHNQISEIGERLCITKLGDKTILGEFFLRDGYMIFKESIASLKLWRSYFNDFNFSNISDKKNIQYIIDSSQEDDNPIVFRYKLKE